MPITENISFQGATTRLGSYLALPEGEGPFPGVVVIHEIFGLNDNIREVARRFADAGYAALAVDLFAGRNRTLCMFRFMGQIQFNSLQNGSIQDLKQSLTYLAALPQVDGNRIGAIGFCMGGSFAIAWACTDERLRVIAPFYAMNPRPLEAVKRLCPVVGSYPTNDFTTKAGQALETKLDTYNIPHDIKIYPETKHSFFNNQRSSYDASASEDAWQRIQAFFKEYL
jgi:carboxymethylenebutenolidase